MLNEDYDVMTKKAVDGRDNLQFTSNANGGKYLLRIVGKKASGHLSVKISSNNELNLNYRDFFKE